jgi:DNA polymerase-4
MDASLRRQGVRSLQDLWALDSKNMKRIWGGVNGERLWRLLRGEDLEESPTRRRSINHSHVLEPSLRTRENAFRIAQKLTCKLGVRLRKMGYRAGGLSVAVQFTNGPSAEAKAKLDQIRDTPTLLRTFKDQWEKLPSRSPLWVGITLYSLIPEERVTPSLFDDGRQDTLSFLMDKLNGTYGHDTAYFAGLHHVKNKAPTRIPFTRVPEDWEMGTEKT